MKETLIDKSQKRKAQAEMFERSYLEWNLLRSLAFGERDWILICAVLFLISDTRDFLTIAGMICMGLGIFFLAPIYGFFMHMISKSIYRNGKARGVMPKTVDAAKKITWRANAYLFPVMLIISCVAVELFYDGYASLTQWTNTPAMQQQIPGQTAPAQIAAPVPAPAPAPAPAPVIEPIAPVSPVSPSATPPADSAPIVAPPQ